MSPAKTNAERQADLKARRIAAGLKPVTNLWCHPSDAAPIREFAEKLAKRRVRELVRREAAKMRKKGTE